MTTTAPTRRPLVLPRYSAYWPAPLIDQWNALARRVLARRDAAEWAPPSEDDWVALGQLERAIARYQATNPPPPPPTVLTDNQVLALALNAARRAPAKEIRTVTAPTTVPPPPRAATNGHITPITPVPGGAPAFNWQQYREVTATTAREVERAIARLREQRAEIDRQLAEQEAALKKLGRVMAIVSDETGVVRALPKPRAHAPGAGADGLKNDQREQQLLEWCDTHDGTVSVRDLSESLGTHFSAFNLALGRLVGAGELTRGGAPGLYRRVPKGGA